MEWLLTNYIRASVKCNYTHEDSTLAVGTLDVVLVRKFALHVLPFLCMLKLKYTSQFIFIRYETADAHKRCHEVN